MTKTNISKVLSLMLCLVLIAAMALFAAACGGNTTPSDDGGSSQLSANNKESIVRGEGDTVFTFKVTFSDGSEKTYKIYTDKTVVGDALAEVGLISGSEGPYGLMVETVDGETVTYDKDGKYWAFYVDGEYAMTGVDSAEIEEDKVYSFKAEQ